MERGLHMAGNSNNHIEKELRKIENKMVFETGNKESYIRVEDIVWMAGIIRNQQKKITELQQKIKTDKKKDS